MDRRSWLWRRRSSASLQKSPAETDSSGSVSSERFSDEQQETLRSSPIDSPSSHSQKPEVSLKDAGSEVDEAVKHLNEKLSAALLSISDKEELAKQHAKLAEEAVLGWEKAEREVTILKQQLETAKNKNFSLEDRLSHLDGALKECVRQLRQSRDEQEQIVQNAVIEKSREWETNKSELEIQLIELQAKLEANGETTNSFSLEVSSKLKILEDENSALKIKIAALCEDLQLRTLEMDLSIRAAETASKQHLESIKKVAKLESECRRLQAAARKSSFSNEQKLIYNSLYLESTTDSQSDVGERLQSLDNEPSCSDSWASALIVELDQFKNKKRSAKDLKISADIVDFLEMEKLAALPVVDHVNSNFDQEADVECARASSSKSELETLHRQIAELEGKFEKMVNLKGAMEISLANTNNQLKNTCNKLVIAEGKVAELQRQLNLVNGEKFVLETELEAAEEKRNEMETQLELAHKEIEKLQVSITSLERKAEEEKRLCLDLNSRSQCLEATEAEKKEVDLELESAYEKIKQLNDKIRHLDGKLEVEKILSVEFASRCQNMDVLLTHKMDLESKLEASNLELCRLREKVDFLETTTEAVEAKRTELEYQLSSANLEVFRLKEKVDNLEAQLEEERSLSAQLSSNVETSEFKRKDLVMLLELANKEIKVLQNRLSILEGEVKKEKYMCAELEAKCLNLEHELSRRKEETEHQQPVLSAAAKIRQADEIATAAGRLAECQKTIASLSKQLKSLASLDDFSFEEHT